ncbi:MAG TPA: FG-GAP-like repeat-containing protein, partial [bacterium]|nr:FG-GAP-like repeat-containing protein [bacterium]
LSLGNNQYTQIEADAVLYAYNAGLAVVCAAGNGGNDGIGDSTPHYPSAHEGAIGVGSTNRFNEKDGSSNYGEDYVDVFAPGVAIRSTLPNNDYRNLSGTSMASPVTAALAALIMSNNPGISPDDVLMRLQKGCEPINTSNPVYRDQLDPGRINYYYSMAETPVIRVEKCVVDDVSGNANHEADEGETVNLQLYLKNKAWMDASNVQISLAAGSGISVVDGSAVYGALASGEMGMNMDPLTLTITGTTHQTVDLTINVIADGGYNDMITYPMSINDPIPQMPGFPVESWGGFNASPRAADLDNDGDLEIITASNDGTIAVYNHDGSYFPGWPVNLMSIQYIDSILILAPPAVADLDMDGDLEIIVADQFVDAEWINPNDPNVGQKRRIQGRVHVFNHDGTNFGGNWPFITQLEFTPQPDDPPEAGFKSGPAVADIAGDQHPEIILGNYGNHVFVFDTMGNIVSGWPRNVGIDVFATAATYDYDMDGKCEVVIATKDDVEPLDSGALHLFDGDGTELPGFPVAWDNQIYSVPVLADLDGDGIPEIIFGWGDYANEVASRGLMVMDMRSEPLTGWPVAIPDTVYASPGLGDLDGDGDLEIVVCTVGAEVYAFHHDGSPVTGFPVTVSADPDAVINSSPTIADLDNDNLPEILFCMEIGFNESASMHILHSDGSPMTGTPVTLVDNGFSSP